MKISILTLFLFTSSVLASIDETTFLVRQKQVLQLLYRINQNDTRHPEYVTIGKTFSVDQYKDSYTKKDVVDNFLQYWNYGILPRNAIFSVMNQKHVEQASVLFKLFYYAKDWDTFYRTTVWARQNLNQEMFIYAFYMAIIHRPDCRKLMLPPIYEVKPNYFFSSEVIHKAGLFKEMYSTGSHDNTYHTVESNYSGWYLNLHPEQSISYFLEDIGISSFYFYYRLHYQSWMSSDEFGWDADTRGENYIALMKYVLARYYAERLGNGLGDIPNIDWETPLETPYEPSLVYPNGLKFPSRPKFANLHEYFYNYRQKWSNNMYGYSRTFVKDYLRRIMDAVDSGFVLKNDKSMMSLYTDIGMNVLGNLIEGNADSLNKQFYGNIQQFASHLLGYSMQPLDDTKLVPSVLEHIETSMRDPIFYQLLKQMMEAVEKYKSKLPPYSEQDLFSPGIKVLSMEVDPLITYDEYFYSDLSNAVWYSPDEKYDFRVRVRQMRMNHKPFSVKIKINSEGKARVNVKLFMAPKVDEWGREINLRTNRINMMFLDHWGAELQPGENELTRNANQFRWYKEDKISQRDLYDSVVKAMENNETLAIDEKQNFFYWPARMMLPKGRKDGYPYIFIAIVDRWEEKKQFDPIPHSTLDRGCSKVTLDEKPPFYPFDRWIKFEKMWYKIPNIYFQDAKIYHKSVQDINSVN